MELNKIYEGKALDVVKQLPDKSINCVITSPPYWQLRDYGWDGQWGLEPTFQMYLENLWSLMDEIYRVLKDDGTAWINLGDTYGSMRGKNGNHADSFERKGNANKEVISVKQVIDRPQKSQYEKCLLLIPHRFAIGCIDRGWIIRNDIVWAKRNGMPESVTDRFSKKHEYFFLMVKSEKYYFDLDGIKDKNKTQENRPHGIVRNRLYEYDSKLNEMQKPPTTKIPKEGAENFGSPRARQHRESNGKSVFGGQKGDGQDENGIYSGKEWFPDPNGKNPGTVSDFWDIPTQPSQDAHYASYNTKLIDKPIIAGCPKDGIILDPFCGTATTGCRAIDLGRKFIGIEGSSEYVKIGNKKLHPYLITQKLF